MPVLSVLVAVLVLGWLIACHELGHLLVGWWVGAAIDEYALGIGPALIRRQIPPSWPLGGLTVSVRLFPFGGFVRFRRPESPAPAGRHRVPDPLGAISPWRRLAVALAGPIASVAAGFCCFAVALAIWGEPPRPTLDGFDSVAAQQFTPLLAAGLQATTTPEVLVAAMRGHAHPTVLTAATTRWRPLGLPTSITTAAVTTTEAVSFLAQMTVWLLANPPVLYDNLSGPVGIVSGGAAIVAVTAPVAPTTSSHPATGRTAANAQANGRARSTAWRALSLGTTTTRGLAILLSYMAILSIGMALINLLPLPPFDGFHAITSVLEGVTRRRLPASLRLMLAIVGAVLFLGLAVRGTLNDLTRASAPARADGRPPAP